MCRPAAGVTVDGFASASFGSVTPIGDSSFALVDWDRGHLVGFDGAQRRSYRASRYGRGPREISRALSLFRGRDGELLVYDQQQRRILVVTPRGEITEGADLRTVRGLGPGWVLGRDREGGLQYRDVTEPRTADSAGTYRFSQRLLRITGDTAVLLATIPGSETVVHPRPGGGLAYSQEVFGKETLIASTGDVVALFDTAGDSLLLLSHEGTRLGRWTLPSRPVRVSADDIAAYYRAYAARSGSASADGARARDRISATRPLVDRVIFDQRAGLWVRFVPRYSPPRRTWLRFDSGGSVTACLTIDGERRSWIAQPDHVAVEITGDDADSLSLVGAVLPPRPPS
jgi:hypothetical protein